jgi:ribosomal protein S12 methylthiotransferase
MVQRYRDELTRELAGDVDAFVGLDELDAIVDAARGGLPAPAAAPRSDLPMFGGPSAPAPALDRKLSRYLYDASTPRKLATPPWTAFVKIAEGCDHTCSFCAIPGFRGAFRSRPAGDVVAEAAALAHRGVKEINLIAQDSSHFGRDRGDDGGLAGLLTRLDAIPELRWVRVHYLYPNTVTDRLIDAMARCTRVVKYVDMPLQHAHPEMLKRMRRGGSADSHLELLGRFRRVMPDAAMRSTFIVGFPGETEQEFEALVAFVEAARFDHLGVFTYSHEDGTSAHRLADDVPNRVKEDRRDRLMTVQQRIAFERNETRLGSTVEVLVEGAHPETDDLLVGRASTQAPDVDGQILLNDGYADAGTFARVLVTETAGYDLVGRILGAA